MILLFIVTFCSQGPKYGYISTSYKQFFELGKSEYINTNLYLETEIPGVIDVCTNNKIISLIEKNWTENEK